jgi:hypothetical protein
MERDRSASPERIYGKRDWFKQGLSKQTLVYFHIVLECDSPILEALFSGIPGRYAQWTGVDPNGMSLYFFKMIQDCFEKRFNPSSPSWNRRIFTRRKYPTIVQWESRDRLIEITHVLYPHDRFPGDAVIYLTRLAIYEGIPQIFVDKTGVALLRDDEIGMNPQLVGAKDEKIINEWILPTPPKIEMEMEKMIAQFYAKHKAFFEKV